MFSVYLYKKLFSIKHLLADSTAPLLLHKQSQFLHAPILLNSSINQFFASFCSLVNVDLSEVSAKSAKKGTKSAEKLDEEKSYTVSYLIKSHGFSPERAACTSAKVRLNGSEKPNSVLALLENYGFTETQIATAVRKTPGILVMKEKTILPKFEFFLSVGMSKDLLASFISRDPSLLQRSLDNLIIPNYKFLKSLLLTDEKVFTAMKQTFCVFRVDIEKHFAPNINVLRELKVPDSCIRLVLLHFPETLVISEKEFSESVSKVLEMGFNPLKSVFVMALHVVSGNSNKLTWDRCYETYSNWGWSKEDIYMAFLKHPHCMIMSQNKISRVMNFLVNKIGLDVKEIVQNPTVLFFNLEKRTIPRFSVIQVLLSRGLIKKFKSSTVLSPAEKYFLNRFVTPYEKEVPELYDIYKGKVGMVEG